MVQYFYAEKATPEVQPARLAHVALCRKVSRCKSPKLLSELGVFLRAFGAVYPVNRMTMQKV